MSAFMTDPSITLRGLQKPESMGEMLSRFAQLKDLASRNRLTDLQSKEANLRIAELQRVAGEGAAQRAALSAGVTPGGQMGETGIVPPGFDGQKALAAMASGPTPYQVPGMQQQFASQDQAAQEQKLKVAEQITKLSTADLANTKQRMDMIGSLAQSVITNPANYLSAKAFAEQNGLVPAGSLPPQFTPDLLPHLQALASQTVSVKDMITAEETKRHNLATEVRKPSAELADFKDFYNTYREAKNLPLNAASELKARQAFAELKRAPTEPRSGTQRNTVERWKQTQLKALRDEATRRLRPDSLTGEATDAMGAEEFRNRWQEIQDSYEEQLNSDRHVEIPLSAAHENLRGGGGAGPQLGGANAGGNAGDTGPRKGEVEVISPDGQRGYIPSANLRKALQRGYKQAAAQ